MNRWERVDSLASIEYIPLASCGFVVLVAGGVGRWGRVMRDFEHLREAWIDCDRSHRNEEALLFLAVALMCPLLHPSLPQA
jgi:hypothetical protein